MQTEGYPRIVRIREASNGWVLEIARQNRPDELQTAADISDVLQAVKDELSN